MKRWVVTCLSNCGLVCPRTLQIQDDVVPAFVFGIEDVDVDDRRILGWLHALVEKFNILRLPRPHFIRTRVKPDAFSDAVVLSYGFTTDRALGLIQ
jgi:hypothetical protein